MSVEAIPDTAELSSPNLAAQPERSTRANRGISWYFLFFFLSGFCSILYELIWLRLAMAQFGVTTPMVSIVLSCFMGGLGVGSFAAGRFLKKYSGRITVPPLQIYAVTEMLIGCSAVIVPLELLAGRYVLEHAGSSLSLSSSGYYIGAGLWLAFTLVPWCGCMGATIPVAMFAIRRDPRLESQRSFSFLYLANVLGAVVGTVIPLALIELWGFTRTLQVGMVVNVIICGAAFWLSGRATSQLADDPSESSSRDAAPAENTTTPTLGKMSTNSTLWLLFATGLTSMGLEVVWTRLYTIFVGTLVYSFAMILGIYLIATFAGSTIYRLWSRRHASDGSLIWMFVWLTALFPLVTADMRFGISAWLRVPLGIAAFSGLLGYLTPRLVDRFSEGDPNLAGIGYAVNVAGCILGPLVSGFLLLPYLDERYALVVLALPWLLVGSYSALAQGPNSSNRLSGVMVCCGAVIASGFLIAKTQSYVQRIPGAQVLRDSTATVVASGHGMDKQLFVNGIGMTVLTPITKIMAALPLASLEHSPQKALVICFGMGTTHRSMLSWDIDSTAVDLVPSVPAFFSYYHADAPFLVRSPHSHIVIDDGRRFLERTTEQYDVIAIDPPPPIGAAGSSLLYSREFYTAAKKRLRPDGILMQWYPIGDDATTASISRAVRDSFKYVRVFRSIEGWGIHYMASSQPLPYRSATELASRMPANATADLVEWGPFPTAEQIFAEMLKKEIPIDALVDVDKTVPAMQDDRPINEYGLLRHTRYWKQ